FVRGHVFDYRLVMTGDALHSTHRGPLSLPPHGDVPIIVAQREAATAVADRAAQRVLALVRDGDRHVGRDRAEAGAGVDVVALAGGKADLDRREAGAQADVVAAAAQPADAEG